VIVNPPPTRSRGGRVRPPLPAPSALARTTLEETVMQGLDRRLILLVAGAGFGKSTLLARLAVERPMAWYTVDASDRQVGALGAGIAEALRNVVPGLVSDIGEVETAGAPASEAEGLERAVGSANILMDALDEVLDADVVLVLDDLQELGGAAAPWRLIETIARTAPARLHLVLLSRDEPPFAIERLRGRGEVLDLGGPAMAFDRGEIATLLENVLRNAPIEAADMPGVAARVHEATGGWPAAVRLAAEALRSAGRDGRAEALARIRAPEGPVFSYLAEEVVAYSSPGVRELIRRISHFDRFSVGLCDALELAEADRILSGLARRALFLQPLAGSSGWYQLHGLVRDYALTHLALRPDEVSAMHRTAATWFEREGLLEAALGSHLKADDPEGLAAFLRRNGGAMTTGGAGREVADAILAVPVEARGRDLELLLGEALLTRAEWAGAIAALRRAGGTDEALDVGVAWRLGVIYGLRGAYDQALEIYDRAVVDGARPADEAFLHAWVASARRHRGEAEETAAAARLSLRAAEFSGDDRALAAAHAAMGNAHEMFRDVGSAIEDYGRALEAAERAADALQRVRILTARGSLEIDLGHFVAALADLEAAVTLASAIGFAAFHARALAERGRAKEWFGRFDEALSDVAAARALYARMNAPGRVYADLDEGELHLMRGDSVPARAALEPAIRAARESNDSMQLGLSLASMAEATAPTDPDLARSLIAEALPIGRRLGSPGTLLGVALTSLLLGERAEAEAYGIEAESLARIAGEPPKVALAMEIQGLSAVERSDGRRLVEAAHEIWVELGSPFGLAMNRYYFARLTDAEAGREAAAEAEAALRGFGARGVAAEAAARRSTLEESLRPEVAIRTLGGFAVLRNGEPAAAGEWRSKKARDLLKILAARRGRHVPRETLFELLWPDEDPEPLGNRLSVALATVRAILDPDRVHDSDWFVGADRASVWLDLGHVELDLETFLTAVGEGRRLQRAGQSEAALRHFERAESDYRGDFLEEDQYEDWASGPRDEAQAAYLDAAREVARAATAGGEPETAIRIQLRILELDVFDERAHLALVDALLAAGRHGEARRRYGVYVAKMGEIGDREGRRPAERRGLSTLPGAATGWPAGHLAAPSGGPPGIGGYTAQARAGPTDARWVFRLQR